MSEHGARTPQAPRALDAYVEAARRSTERTLDDVGEQRVLERIREARRESPVVRRRRTWIGGAMAIAAACALAAVAWRGGWTPGAGTAGGDESGDRSVALATLPDGSTIEIFEPAAVDESFGHEERLVLQSGGRVRYTVVREGRRPFVVRHGDTTITVLGTVFEVHVRGAEVEVFVERGRVAVDARRVHVELRAGERIVVTSADERAAEAPPAERPPAARPAAETAPVEGARGAAEATSSDPGPVAEGPPPRVPTLEESLARFDELRARGDMRAAVAELRRALEAHPGAREVDAAFFTLGRAEGSLGRHVAAARAYRSCVAASASGPLAEDARAAIATELDRAGRAADASAAAADYLVAHPDGVHAGRMRAIAGVR